MSTMRVTNLKHENSASNNIVLNSDGSVGGDLATTLASKLDLAGGKILQIVRATDSTNRSTTSTSYVDVTGMSVTITPQKSDSAILVVLVVLAYVQSDNNYIRLKITDSSNNAVSGANDVFFGATAAGNVNYASQVLFGYSTPATTSATTYKARFASNSGTQVNVRNDMNIGQLYAIEVSA